MEKNLLELTNLRTYFHTDIGTVKAVDDLTVKVKPGQTLGIVGESGSGKSVTSLTVMKLLPQQVARIEEGSKIMFEGRNLLNLSEDEMRSIRGSDISMIFQEPMTSLNPVFTIGQQISEVLRLHRGVDNAEARDRSVELLQAVRIPDAAARVDDYPHQLSGGQRQRVMIAIALACEPEILIADEPTTALDVTVQAEIFDLLRDLGAKLDTAIILITHDMGAVAQMSERMLVMYAGRRVEEGQVANVIKAPAHPYTRGLIACVPHITSDVGALVDTLQEIDGIVPPITHFGRDECLFAPRCAKAADECWSAKPQQSDIAGHSSHSVSCWHPFGTEGSR